MLLWAALAALRRVVRACFTGGMSQADITKALRAVHARFFLSATTLNVAVVGPGLVGGELLDQLKEQCCKLRERYRLDVRVLAIATSSRVLLSQTGAASAAHVQPRGLDTYSRAALPSTCPASCGILVQRRLRWTLTFLGRRQQSVSVRLPKCLSLCRCGPG